VESVVIANVLPADRDVAAHVAPADGCEVHQPANSYEVLVSVPEFAATVTVAPLAYAVVSVGTVPPVLPFPLYVTEYVVAVHVAVNVTLPDTVPDAGYVAAAA